MGKMTDLEMAELLAQKVAEKGGRAYYVGGFVRDRVLNIENKDIDIEIHGIEYSELTDILDSLGGHTEMGAAFGISGIRGYDIDIAMPRKEKATGRGHKDFEVFVDPFIGPEKAAMRRDFTMNALMQDVLTGEILDFFGGCDDMKKGIIRHVNDGSFAEDPLRVLRAAQFASRFSMAIAPETVELCSRMDLSTLSRERIMGELEKALLKAGNPSIFFETLREMNQLSYWFAELEKTIGISQDPAHHPEGDVWVHTMKVLDCAAKLRPQAKQKTEYMLSALCHDFGKIVTTENINGTIHAYRHETEGLELVESFLHRLSNENNLIRYVLNMTELHMRPNMMVHQHSSYKAFMRLFDLSVEPDDLILLSKADFQGSLAPYDYSVIENVLRARLDEYRELMKKPSVQGADLIAAGFSPGPEFKEALAYAHKLHLAGVEKSLALRQTTGFLKALKDKKNSCAD